MNETPSSPASSDAADRLPATPAAPPLVVPVIEERAVINREIVESGRVRLRKTVQEHTEDLDLTLQHEEVHVERVPVNQYVADNAAPPTLRHEGDTLVVPVVREVMVKRLLVVEELRVTKQRVQTQDTQRVTLRHEEVQVDRVAGSGAASPASDTVPPSV